MANVLGIIRNKASGIMTKIRKNKTDINNVKQIYIGEGMSSNYTDTSVTVTYQNTDRGIASNAYVFDHYIFFVFKDGSTSHTYHIYDLYNDAIDSNNYLIDPARQLARACNSSKTTVPSPQDNAFFIHFLVHNNELYALGGVSKTNTNSSWNVFKKYNPKTNTWTSLTNLPIYFSRGVEVSANSGIHIFQDLNHYYWDGSSWKKGEDLPSALSVSNTYSNAYGNKSYDAFLQYDFIGDESNLGYNSEVIVVCKNTSPYNQAYCYFVNGTSITADNSFIDKIKPSVETNNPFYCGGLNRRSLSANGVFVSLATASSTTTNAYVYVTELRAINKYYLPNHYYNNTTSSDYGTGYLVCYQGCIYKIGLIKNVNTDKYYYDCYLVAATQNIKIENS